MRCCRCGKSTFGMSYRCSALGQEDAGQTIRRSAVDRTFCRNTLGRFGVRAQISMWSCEIVSQYSAMHQLQLEHTFDQLASNVFIKWIDHLRHIHSVSNQTSKNTRRNRICRIEIEHEHFHAKRERGEAKRVRTRPTMRAKSTSPFKCCV